MRSASPCRIEYARGGTPAAGAGSTARQNRLGSRAQSKSQTNDRPRTRHGKLRKSVRVEEGIQFWSPFRSLHCRRRCDRGQ